MPSPTKYRVSHKILYPAKIYILSNQIQNYPIKTKIQKLHYTYLYGLFIKPLHIKYIAMKIHR